MNDFDENSENPAQLASGPMGPGSGEEVYPGTVAWLRQLTLWTIITQPWLLVYHPRLFLEKPWLLVLLFGIAGLLTGGIAGAQQGVDGGIGKMIENSLLGGFVAGVVGAVVQSPVALALWVLREVGRTRFAARRSPRATSDSRLTAAPIESVTKYQSREDGTT